MNQPSLFDGPGLVPALDDERLDTQLARVYHALKNSGWWTLADLAKYSGGSEAGVSARIRDLRKPRFGGYSIARRRRTDTLWEYRMDG